MTFQRSGRLAVVVAASGAAILCGGCGGSTDSTTSANPAEVGPPAHAVPVEHPSKRSSASGSAKGHEQPSSQQKQQSPQASCQAAKPRSAAGSPPASTAKRTADALAEIEELVGGSGGGRQRTASTPKQVHKVLRELQDRSGDHTSGGQESDQSGAGGGVEKILETLGGN